MKKFFSLLLLLLPIDNYVNGNNSYDTQLSAKFFRISGNGLTHSSYLLGSLHTIPGDYIFEIEHFEETLHKVSQIVCEINTSEYIQNYIRADVFTWQL